MSAGMNITIDAREFNAAAERLIKMSSRTYPEFVNGQLYFLAIRAIKETEKASPAKIRGELGSGKDSLGARIVNARLRDAGKPLVWGKALDEAVAKLKASRIRAIGFTKSGWLPAVRALAAHVKFARRAPRGVKQFGVPKGSARPARPAISAVVSGDITNTALREPGVLPVGERGLARALAAQTASMLAELQRRIQKDIDGVK